MEFLTLIVEVEAILNTRPLTYVNSDEYQVVRPIDFILPTSFLMLPNYDLNRDEFIPHQPNTKSRFIEYCSNATKSSDKFWETWRNEYLISLRKLTQTEHNSPRNAEKRIPIEGEIVLLNEPEIPRGLWKLPIMKEIRKGRDNNVRSTIIEIPNKRILNRPINLLYPLGISDETPIKQERDNEDMEEPIAARTSAFKR